MVGFNAAEPVARVLVADHALIRLGVRAALRDEDDLEVCAEADDADEAVAEAHRTRPHVCLVGLDLPGGGLAAVEGIYEASPSSTVIVMAGDGNADDLLASVRAGAVGYLTANTTSAALRRVLRAVLADEAAIPRELVRDLIFELRSSTFAEGRVTARESQILSMLRRGQSTADIAERLQISAVTVRRHISGLVHKLEVEDRAALTSAKPTARSAR